MTTTFRECFYLVATRDRAQKLVDEIDARLSAATPNDAEQAVVQEEPPDGLEGLSVVPTRAVDSDASEAVEDVYYDLDIDLSDAPIPSPEDARQKARATGYTARSFVFEDEAMERLARCASAIVLEYPARLSENPVFIAIEKRLLEEAGAGVVESGEGTVWETTESFAARSEREWRGLWSQARVFGRDPPRSRRSKKVRAAKVGELEAIAIHGELTAILAGDDPFRRDALRRALEIVGDDVRAYAAVLVEDGAMADAQAAKALEWKAREVAEARTALDGVLSGLPRD